MIKRKRVIGVIMIMVIKYIIRGNTRMGIEKGEVDKYGVMKGKYMKESLKMIK